MPETRVVKLTFTLDTQYIEEAAKAAGEAIAALSKFRDAIRKEPSKVQL